MPPGIGYGKRSGIKKRMKRDSTTTGFAGNYAAPVDTAGMDPEMKRTLTPKAKRAASRSPLSKLLRTFGINID